MYIVNNVLYFAAFFNKWQRDMETNKLSSVALIDRLKEGFNINR